MTDLWEASFWKYRRKINSYGKRKTGNYFKYLFERSNK